MYALGRVLVVAVFVCVGIAPEKKKGGWNGMMIGLENGEKMNATQRNEMETGVENGENIDATN